MHFGIAAIMDVLQKAGSDAEDAARYRWFRNECDYGEREDIVSRTSTHGHLLDHFIDKSRCRGL